MDPLNGKERVRRSLIPGLLVSGAAVVALVVVADPGRAFQILLSARPTEIVLSVAACGLGLVARAAASREFIDGRVPLGGSFAALNIGYLANNLLPLRAGEAIRSVVLGRRSGLGLVGGATAVGAQRQRRQIDVRVPIGGRVVGVADRIADQLQGRVDRARREPIPERGDPRCVTDLVHVVRLGRCLLLS